jgi:hypothetical protein
MLHLLWDYIKRVKLKTEYKGYYYKAHQMLFVWICGTMCGLTTMKDVWVWANTEKVRELFRLEIGLQYFAKYPMFTIILGKFDEKSFEKEYRKWVLLFLPEDLKEKVVSFDGKTIKTTANRKDLTQSLHIVSAYITELGLTLGQLAVNDKTNEIPTVQLLIKQLDLEGTIVVADAMNCPKKQ